MILSVTASLTEFLGQGGRPTEDPKTENNIADSKAAGGWRGLVGSQDALWNCLSVSRQLRRP